MNRQLFANRLMFALLSAILSLPATGCMDPLVNEGYAVPGQESINGLDLFEEALAEKGTVTRSQFADGAKFKDADLIVYVQKAPFLAPNEMENIKKAFEAAVVKPEGAAVSGMVSEPAGGMNLLILQRGLSASPAFWSRLLRSFPEDVRHARIRAYIKDRLENGEPLSRLSESAYFFKRFVLEGDQESAPVDYHPVDRLAFLFEPGRLPASIPAGIKILSEDLPDGDAVYRRTIIGLENGAFFAEAALSGGHLFLVSDTTPFLNFHLARTEYHTLLDFILDRSLKYANVRGRPRILIVEGWNTKQEEMAQERSLLAFFFRPPWSLPFVLLGILFVLFVWSRLLRERPVTEAEVEDRDGDLLRHFRGVANLLLSSRQKSPGSWIETVFKGKRKS